VAQIGQSLIIMPRRGGGGNGGIGRECTVEFPAIVNDEVFLMARTNNGTLAWTHVWSGFRPGSIDPALDENLSESGW